MHTVPISKVIAVQLVKHNRVSPVVRGSFLKRVVHRVNIFEGLDAVMSDEVEEHVGRLSENWIPSQRL